MIIQQEEIMMIMVVEHVIVTYVWDIVKEGDTWMMVLSQLLAATQTAFSPRRHKKIGWLSLAVTRLKGDGENANREVKCPTLSGAASRTSPVPA